MDFPLFEVFKSTVNTFLKIPGGSIRNLIGMMQELLSEILWSMREDRLYDHNGPSKS